MHRDPDELRRRLTPEQYDVTQNGGTERPFTGAYWDTNIAGTYVCIVCEVPLFGSDAKYDAGTGWPTFISEIASGRVHPVDANAAAESHPEARCSSCGAHLGRVFSVGPDADDLRYSINSAALRFVPRHASA